jgi:hypothetical protein
MALYRLTRRLSRGALALTVVACVALFAAGAATARPMDSPPALTGPTSSPPTVVKETVVQPDNGGTDTIVFVLIGAGAGVAILAAGYVGARMATRSTRPRPTNVRAS